MLTSLDEQQDFLERGLKFLNVTSLENQQSHVNTLHGINVEQSKLKQEMRSLGVEVKTELDMLSKNQSLLFEEHKNNANAVWSQVSLSITYQMRTILRPTVTLFDRLREDMPHLIYTMAEEGVSAALKNDKFEIVSSINTFNSQLTDVKLYLLIISCLNVLLFLICVVLVTKVTNQ